MDRHFLGWDQPFLTEAVTWLWGRRDQFTQTLLIVPTMESGRKLRQALAECGPCLAPLVMTAGQYSSIGYVGTEQPLLEQLVWQTVLEDFDWKQVEKQMPKPVGDFWEEQLAQQFVMLRKQTGEYGLDFEGVKNQLGSNHPDIERWRLLARWEYTYKLRLEKTQHARRSAKTFEAKGVEHHALISAPDSESVGFDELGVPISDYWSKQKIEWKGGEKEIFSSTEPRAQARLICSNLGKETCGSASSVALCIGDKDDTSLLQKVFKDKGVSLYNPAGKPLSDWSFVNWYRAWIAFGKDKKVADLMALARSPWTFKLIPEVEITPHLLTSSLQRICEQAKPNNVRDLWHLKTSGWYFDAKHKFTDELNLVIDALTALKPAQDLVSRRARIDQLQDFLTTVLGGEESDEAMMAEEVFTQLVTEASVLNDWLLRKVDLRREFILRLEAATIGESREVVHLEALGWLELAFEQSRNLLITGLNEGILPNTEIGDSWLPESLRKQLGMKTNEDRFAHDIYYLKSLCESRKEQGGIQGYFLKYSALGDPLKPSRLLLQVPAKSLAKRVKYCFSGEPASLLGQPWERDWSLKVNKKRYQQGLSATKIASYLACPFRFYLNTVEGMSPPKASLSEWDHMEFGSLTHLILERMGNDEEAKKMTDPNILHRWLVKAFQEEVEFRFAEEIPLAFKIQVESLIQRFRFFAHIEVEDRLYGGDWKTVACEEKFKLEIEGVVIYGDIDRVDQNPSGQYRLVDYKTGKASDAKNAHMRDVRGRKLAEHLAGTAVEFSYEGKTYHWANLQLPIYALAYMEKTEQVPELAYCTIAESANNTCYHSWDFTQEEADLARAALVDIVQAIKAQKFWPPAEKVTYDDFESLSYGRPLIEGVTFGEEIFP